MKKVVWTAVAGILLAFLIWAVAAKFYSYTSPTEYSAVFLTNGQVYFGHLIHQDNQVFTLSDVFYLRANPKLQDTKSTEAVSQGNVDLSLIKLGNEIHGPQNTLYISREQVIFWEKLREDSKIVTAIKKYPK